MQFASGWRMDVEPANPRRQAARVPLLIGAVLGLWLLVFLVDHL
jgi:hypothetical protein